MGRSRDEDGGVVVSVCSVILLGADLLSGAWYVS